MFLGPVFLVSDLDELLPELEEVFGTSVEERSSPDEESAIGKYVRFLVRMHVWCGCGCAHVVRVMMCCVQDPNAIEIELRQNPARVRTSAAASLSTRKSSGSSRSLVRTDGGGKDEKAKEGEGEEASK